MVSFLLPRGMQGVGEDTAPRTASLSPPPFPSLLSPTLASGWNAASAAAFVTPQQSLGGSPAASKHPPGGLPSSSSPPSPPGLPRAATILQSPKPRLGRDPCSCSPSASPCVWGGRGSQAPVLGCSSPAAPPRTPALPPWPKLLDLVTKGSTSLQAPQSPRVYRADTRERCLMQVPPVQGPRAPLNSSQREVERGAGGREGGRGRKEGERKGKREVSRLPETPFCLPQGCPRSIRRTVGSH